MFFAKFGQDLVKFDRSGTLRKKQSFSVERFMAQPHITLDVKWGTNDNPVFMSSLNDGHEQTGSCSCCVDKFSV